MKPSEFTEAAFPVHRFAYNPTSGAVTGPDGERVGTDNGRGYLRVQAGGLRVMAHRLAWRLQTGQWPAGELDHANGDSLDNRWSNLRTATSSQNRCNMVSRARNRGAYWDRTNCGYLVAVQVSGERHQWRASSYFSAVVAARLIRRVLHGEFAIESRTTQEAA